MGQPSRCPTHTEGDGDGGVRGVYGAADNTCVDQPDKGNEEADTHYNCGFEALGDRLKDGGAEAGQHEGSHEHTRPHDQPHNLRPGEVGGAEDSGCQ